MPEPEVTGSEAPRLSDLLRRGTSRRAFLARATALGATLPTALAACTKSTPSKSETGAAVPPQQNEQPVEGVYNPSSREDTSIREHTRAATSVTPATQQAATVPYRRWDPTLPPLSKSRELELHWRATEVPVAIMPDVVIAGWTFEGDIPGPIVHVRQGDTVKFTLTNEGHMPHSMDFHAAQVDPKTAFRSVMPGQSVSYTFKARHPGAFMYHCGTAPVLMHIGSGMYGAIIVDPATPLPRAKEFVLVQSEFYLGPAQNGVRPSDYNKMMATLPDYVAFNGRPGQYQTEPLRVKVGDRVRFHVVNAGPTNYCAFHMVGEQFETVYLGAPPGNAIHGVQTFAVPAGGGMIFEFVADVPGEFPFVNHGFGHGQKGAIGMLVVES